MSSTLKPGEINLSLIPLDWPLTPIGDRKNPYIQGWQNKPFAVEDVGKELEEGRAKAVGLIGGPVYRISVLCGKERAILTSKGAT